VTGHANIEADSPKRYCDRIPLKGRYWEVSVKGSIPLLAATVFLSLGALAWAAEPERVPSLALPIQCEPGKTCWIVTHVDRDPSQGIRDYMCGRATYDGHKGVDFAVRDMRAVRKGVSVVAAVSGVVVGRRDGMRDVPVSNKDAVKDRECGNGVYVRSPGGWSIKYCHMRRGSIAVEKGDKVKTGQHLGMVGLSGKTNFPHLHLEVLHGKKVIDPFTGPPPASRCGPGKHALWKPEVLAALPYRSVQLNNAGFAATRPKTSTAREGLLNESVLPRQAPVLFLWLDVFRSRPGDRLHMRILDPDGEPILDYDTDIKQAKDRFIYFAGLKRKAGRWDAGTYVGVIRLIRAEGPGGREDYTIKRQVILR
jgi:hypothetical protein